MLEAKNLNDFTGSIGPDIITDGLVFYNDYANPKCYISGSTTCNDLSNNQLIGTLSGCTYSGNSLYFNGSSDYGVTNYNLDLSSTNKITVSFWCKFTTAAPMILTEHSTNYNFNNSFVFYVDVDGKIYFMTRDNALGLNGCNTNSAKNNGNWYHVCGVCNRDLLGSAQTVLYINGVNDTVRFSNTNLTVNFTTFKLYIGARAGSSLFFYNNIANISIYNRALSQQEITQNYNATKSRFNL